MRTRTAKWYETTVRYERSKGDENNIATEAYAVDALSFAEAEQRITEEMEPYCSGEFDVRKSQSIRMPRCSSPKMRMMTNSSVLPSR